MSSEYRDIVERFAEGLSPQEFALFEKMTEEQRKDVMYRAGVLRDDMARGGIMNGRQGFYAGGGADMGAPGLAGERAAAGYGNPSGGLAAPGGADPDGADGDPDGDTDGDEEESSFFGNIGNYLSSLVTPQNLTTAGISMAFPGFGLASGVLNALAASPLGQYMGPYDESMVGPNPNGLDPVIATVDPMAEQAAQVADITANYDSTQLAMFNDLIAQGYPENYAASVVSSMLA